MAVPKRKTGLLAPTHVVAKMIRSQHLLVRCALNAAK